MAPLAGGETSTGITGGGECTWKNGADPLKYRSLTVSVDIRNSAAGDRLTDFLRPREPRTGDRPRRGGALPAADRHRGVSRRLRFCSVQLVDLNDPQRHIRQSGARMSVAAGLNALIV